jgi:DNA-binding GntR family transcriptional regulator
MEKVNLFMAKDRVVAILREEILSGNLKPGQKLVEKELSEKLGVSRTPLREAIRMLEVEGLVESIPNRGSRVASITIKDIINLYELRINLEGLATRKSVPYLTKEMFKKLHDIQNQIRKAAADQQWKEVDVLNQKFHALLLSVGDNDRLLALIEQLNQIGRLIRISAFKIPGRANRVIEEHEKILTAAEAKNAELAGTLMEKHLEQARDTLLEHMKDKEKEE